MNNRVMEREKVNQENTQEVNVRTEEKNPRAKITVRYESEFTSRSMMEGIAREYADAPSGSYFGD